MPARRTVAGPHRDYHYSERPFAKFAFGTTQSYVKRSIRRLRPLADPTDKTPRTYPARDTDRSSPERDVTLTLDVVGEIAAGCETRPAYSSVVLGKAQALCPLIARPTKTRRTRQMNRPNTNVTASNGNTTNNNNNKPLEDSDDPTNVSGREVLRSTYFLSQETFTSSNIAAAGAAGGARENHIPRKPHPEQTTAPSTGGGRLVTVLDKPGSFYLPQLLLPETTKSRTNAASKRIWCRPVHVLTPRFSPSPSTGTLTDDIVQGLTVKSLESHRQICPPIDNTRSDRAVATGAALPPRAERHPVEMSTSNGTVNGHHGRCATKGGATYAGVTCAGVTCGASRISVGEGLLVNVTRGSDIGGIRSYVLDEKYSVTEWNRQKVENMKLSTLKSKESLLNIRQLCQRSKRDRLRKDTEEHKAVERRRLADGAQGGAGPSPRTAAETRAPGPRYTDRRRVQHHHEDTSVLDDKVQPEKTKTTLSIIIANPPPSVASSQDTEREDSYSVLTDEDWKASVRDALPSSPTEGRTVHGSVTNYHQTKEFQSIVLKREDGRSRLQTENGISTFRKPFPSHQDSETAGTPRESIDVRRQLTENRTVNKSPVPFRYKSTKRNHPMLDRLRPLEKKSPRIPRSKATSGTGGALVVDSPLILPVYVTPETPKAIKGKRKAANPEIKYHRSITITMPAVSLTTEDEDKDVISISGSILGSETG